MYQMSVKYSQPTVYNRELRKLKLEFQFKQI